MTGVTSGTESGLHAPGGPALSAQEAACPSPQHRDRTAEPDPLPLPRGDRRRRCSASLVGLAAPDVAVELKPLGTGFVALIKMMIQPVIFCTIVLGVGSVRQAAQVGKVGGLALGYFLVMSTVALAIGLVVGNLIQPGAGLHLDDAAASAGQEQAAAGTRRAPPTSCSGSSPPRCSPP